MRQAGVMAAAGLFALRHTLGRLADDHVAARRLAAALNALDGISVATPQTNILFVHVAAGIAPAFQAALNAARILTTGSPGLQRWVTHRSVSGEDVDRVIDTLSAFGARA